MKNIEVAKAHYRELKNENIDIAILPWGATEPHNYHLPYGTDIVLASEVARCGAIEAAKKEVNAMVLPTIPFGQQNAGQSECKMCIHLSSSVQSAILRDVVSSLKRQNIDKLVIINGHGGNCFKNILRDLQVEMPDFTIVAINWWQVAKGDEYFEAEIDDHAGEMETSVLMYIAPELVLPLSEAGDGSTNGFNIEGMNKGYGWTPRHWTKVSTDTGLGDPRKATADKGGRFFKEVTKRVANLLVDLATKPLYL